MPESLIDLLSQSFDAINFAQGIVIALITALAMRRYGGIVYFSIFAIIIDQFVTIAYAKQIWGKQTVADVLAEIVDSILELDATVVIIRLIGFMVVITLIYGIRSLFRN